MAKEFTRIITSIAKYLESFGSRAIKSNYGPQKFGTYEVVEMCTISEIRTVPPHIPTPPYLISGEELISENITIKNDMQIVAMRSSCSLARSVLNAVGKYIRVGLTTDELDAYAHNLILSKGAFPSPLGYRLFPKSICTSVNNIIVHGIPDSRQLKDGDIISVDVTVYKDGYHGDCAETYLVGNVDEPGRRLVEGAREIMYAGIDCCGPNVPFSEIGRNIEKAAKKRNLTVIPSVTGHGIGEFFHEDPCIWHIDTDEYDEPKIMLPGMTFTIEPAIGQGTDEATLYEEYDVLTTYDNSRAAQFEHTVLITDTGHEILTK